MQIYSVLLCGHCVSKWLDILKKWHWAQNMCKNNQSDLMIKEECKSEPNSDGVP